MNQRVESKPIRQFYGIATKVSGTDEPRGTLRVAVGTSIAPTGAISNGPTWATAWGQSTLGTAIATALSGATASKVHFVTLTRSGYTFLIAWNKTEERPRGIWPVAGTGDPAFTASSGSAVTAPNNATYRDKTTALTWFGSWINGLSGGELWLGNGTDGNLIWASGALAILGPSGTPDAMDISQFVFPPCKAFVQAPTGERYGAGNASLPFRIWSTETPNISYPYPQGIRTQTLSYKDIQPPPGATGITTLSIVGESLIAHFDVGSPMVLTRTRSQGGWRFDQRPLEANAGALCHTAARDTKIGPLYLGADLEIYSLKQKVAYGKTDVRGEEIVTDASDGDWNAMMTKPSSGTDYFTVFDGKDERFWIWALNATGSRQALWCYDIRNRGVTGPWFYPDLLSVCQIRDENLNGCVVAGITRDGVFLWSDLSAFGNPTLEDYSNPLGAAYAELTVAPTSDPGIPYVGVSADGLSFKQVLNGQILSMATPWSAFTTNDVTCTRFYKNAFLQIIELSEDDAGSPDLQKEFIQIRALFLRSSRAYWSTWLQCSGYSSSGGWRGLVYPYPSWLSNTNGQGPTARLRLICVVFNDAYSIIQSITPEWQAGAEN
jgi:hypothetical protein